MSKTQSLPSKEENPEGLYGKYTILKSDGTPIPEEQEFFVLRLDEWCEPNHLKACREAVLKYAEEIHSYLPKLSEDIQKRWRSLKEERQFTELSVKRIDTMMEEVFKEVYGYLYKDGGYDNGYETWVLGAVSSNRPRGFLRSRTPKDRERVLKDLNKRDEKLYSIALQVIESYRVKGFEFAINFERKVEEEGGCSTPFLRFHRIFSPSYADRRRASDG